jgi:N-acetylmuramoyl-L-alanine amidase
MLIALDNGHGANTPGKRTPKFEDGTFMHEWEFNRRVVQILAVELQRCGFSVLEVSPTDEDTDLMVRTARANTAKADLFLSVHANALTGSWGNARGIETLTAGVGESVRVGAILQRHLVADTGLYDRGLKDGTWLGVVKYTRMPAVLVECGFMDNLNEARLLVTEEYRRVCAVALAKGVCEAYSVQYIEEDDEEMKEQLAALEKQVQELTATCQELKANASMKAPLWSAEAVAAAVRNGLIDTPDGGSYDFYRILTVMYRQKLFK